MGQKESRSAALNYAFMKRTELEAKIQELNNKCAKCFDQSTLNMLFAVKSLDDKKEFMWQGSVRIHCFTVLDGKVYRKTYNLYQFLKFYESFIQILEASEASNEPEDLATNQNLMRMSIFDDSCCGWSDVEGQCVICFNAQPDRVLPCAHAYCSHCVDTFRSIDQSSCPLCRHPLTNHGQDDAWLMTEKPKQEAINRYLVQPPTAQGGEGQRAQFDSDID